ncbi:DUF6527 family protein [Candidatus Thalassolituus haligoni]|uniref:DUF6527 family protein n=1 Tax=Candidatus Thalassolituus haligoni TaxID=3100113 RepID=UPI0035170F4B
MKTWIINTARQLGLLKADFTATERMRLPSHGQREDEEFILVRDGSVSKWATFRCPGACGERIDLSLNPHQRPHWKVTLDWWRRPTVSPSVHQRNTCGCHFWIRKGNVVWCKGG